ncbi:hypothetical protein CYMTET_55884 [Cymbomonas tetramitiformis]|uniref:OTU domain-containing protein n=1 Tax=Cymbomonas tetramitiformis TaxID=36881 RepID=A0AAE0EPB2_9CHLO|nr:hypothetical protein CYMTET_55884 [Cymbomonas tetramitiformis]
MPAQANLPPEFVLNTAVEQDIAARLNRVLPPDKFVHLISRVATVMKARLAEARTSIAEMKSSSFNPSEAAATKIQSAWRAHKTRCVVSGLRLLNQRLDAHGLRSEESVGDGNCLFRSISNQLFGTQDWHGHIRARACEWIDQRRESYMPFFDGRSQDFTRWLNRMKRSRVWGNELTLRAIADVYGITIHVVQSTSENWHVIYEPELAKIPKAYVSHKHLPNLSWKRASREELQLCLK